MPLYSLSDRSLSQLAGFDAIEQPEEPGTFVWVRLTNGHEVDRSPQVFGSPDEAWADAIDAMVESTVSDAAISYGEWDGLTTDRQESLVRESFPCCPQKATPLAEHLA